MQYEFKREDNGEIVERDFPMGKCPKFIVCDDGMEAMRIFSVPFVSIMGTNGHVTGDGAAKLNADMRKRQDEANKRMRERWKSVRSESGKLRSPEVNS